MAELAMEFDAPAVRCIACGGPIRPWGRKVAHGLSFAYDRCGRCGLVFVNPRPTLGSLCWFYENYASVAGTPKADGPTPAPSQSTPELPPPVPYPPQRRLLCRMLAERPGPGRFLDVGSGSGLAAAAAHEAGLTVTALEVEPAFARSIARLGPDVEVVRAIYEQFERPPGSFDYILMSQVLEHVHDPRAFVARAAAMLAPDGLLWILVPSVDSVYRRLLGTRDPYFTPPGHLNHFNPPGLARLCRSTGLEFVRSEDYHDVPRNVVSKRLPAAIRPAIEGATAVGASIATWATGLCGWGAFVSCVARKRA